MRSPGRRVLVLIAVLLTATVFPACENPFDPLDKSEEIRGLSFIDFSLTWDKWDSDPESDGVIVTIDYSNEFGDALSFRDKPHQVVVEFYTEKLAPGFVLEEDEILDCKQRTCTFDRLIFSFPIEHDHSDDDIRIPIEAYQGALQSAGFEFTDTIELFVVVRVFPPKAVPQAQIVAFASAQEVFVPEEADGEVEDLP